MTPNISTFTLKETAPIDVVVKYVSGLEARVISLQHEVVDLKKEIKKWQSDSKKK